MTILSFFGLMTIKEHEDVAEANKGLLRDLAAERQKFKTAASDLAAQSFEIDALRPDAERWRQRLANDRASRAKRSAGK